MNGDYIELVIGIMFTNLANYGAPPCGLLPSSRSSWSDCTGLGVSKERRVEKTQNNLGRVGPHLGAVVEQPGDMAMLVFF